MRRFISPRASVLIAAWLSLLASSCGGDGDGRGAEDQGERRVTTTSGDLELGEVVFARDCAACHGPSGEGGVGLKLADGRVVERYPDPADHRAVVVEGRGAMPAWGSRLSDEEIDAVVRYERKGL